MTKKNPFEIPQYPDNPTRFKTAVVRLAFPHIFEKTCGKDANNRPIIATTDEELKNGTYSLCALVRKDDANSISVIKAAIEAAKKEGLSLLKNSKGVIPSDIDITFRDGDEKAEDYPEFEGCYYFNAKTKTSLQVVDRSFEPLTVADKEKVYAGCYVRVIAHAYAFNRNGNKGITFGLDGVQYWAKGNHIYSGMDVAAALDDGFEDDSYDNLATDSDVDMADVL